jgi:CheY-like chemotaxis protein
MKAQTAPSAQEAIRRLTEAQQAGHSFQLLLTDAYMPDVDGFALVESLRRRPELGSTVIMMLSSGDPPDRVSRCEELGVSAYLTKPVKQSELLDAIMLAVGVTAVEDEPRTPLSQQRGLRPLHILLAEDSLVNQKLAVALLEREGHTVTIAGNGREAVEAYDSAEFDLVLMDVQMPQMDGFEATAIIRSKQEKTGRRAPIIAMTAHALKGDRERCLKAGMDDYVAKPIKARLLFDTIVAVLAGSASSKTRPANPPSGTQGSPA